MPGHAQSIAGDHRCQADYNPAKSHRHPSGVMRYAVPEGNPGDGDKKPCHIGLYRVQWKHVVKPINQNVKVAKVFWMGVLAASNARRFGILDAITA